MNNNVYEKIEELNAKSSELVEGRTVREVSEILQTPTGTGVISNAGTVKFYNDRRKEYIAPSDVDYSAKAQKVIFSKGYGFEQINATIHFYVQ